MHPASRARPSVPAPDRRSDARDDRPAPTQIGPRLVALIALAVLGGLATAEETPAPARTPDAARGRQHILETAYVPPLLDQRIFEALWQVWPAPLKAQAEAADASGRRALAFARYGLTLRPGDEASGKPLQFVVDDQGRWSFNCFTCHQGHVDGKIVPGVPNSHIALQTLADDILKTKRRLEIPIGPYDLASRVMPLGTTNGTTNAVTFSVVLLKLRDLHLNVTGNPMMLMKETHHDLDAPAWWHLKRRSHLYIDGFAKRNARTLMQFMLVPQNGPEVVRAAEADYEDILAWLLTLEAPRYPGVVDRALAARGERLFAKHCASCHGTKTHYPDKVVPIDVVGTDRVRLDAISPEQRTLYARSWFTDFDPEGVRTDPGGYVAPPLDGVWASAPYFHNGSVPTLWHVLHPAQRPAAWSRDAAGYDHERMGLRLRASGDAVPEDVTTPEDRRTWFDTTKPGKSAAGHTFPDALDAAGKRAVLEYLKTL